MISLGVTTPGVIGTPSLMASAMTSASEPGDTRNFAPASTASCTCCTFTTVPAPTIIPGTSFATFSMDALAADVRKVISMALMPPFSSAFAVGTACSASSNTTTGTTPQAATCSTVNINTTSLLI